MSRANVMSSLKTLNRLPSTSAFSAAEKWTVRGTGVNGFISFIFKPLECPRQDFLSPTHKGLSLYCEIPKAFH